MTWMMPNMMQTPEASDSFNVGRGGDWLFANKDCPAQLDGQERRVIRAAGKSRMFTMRAMPSSFDQLIDATIAHIEQLKQQGVRHLQVSPEAMAGLQSAPATASGAMVPPPAASAPAQARTFAPVAPAPAAPIVRPAPQSVPTVAPAAPKPALDPQAKAEAMQSLREGRWPASSARTSRVREPTSSLA